MSASWVQIVGTHHAYGSGNIGFNPSVSGTTLKIEYYDEIDMEIYEASTTNGVLEFYVQTPDGLGQILYVTIVIEDPYYGYISIENMDDPGSSESIYIHAIYAFM